MNRFLILILLIFSNSYLALSQKRIALVIGNSNYKIDPLKNTLNDARLMDSTLRKLNFDVKLHENLSKRDFDDAITEFIKASVDTTVELALFYYAGHAYEFNSKNFLLPIDISTDSYDNEVNLIDVQYHLVQGHDNYSNSPLVVILDACRNNPYYKTRGAGIGIKHIESPRGSLIAYSAESGKTAPDGNGTNSLYTSVLCETIIIPGITIDDVFKKTKQKVYEIDKNQLPGFYSNLVGDIYIIPPAFKSQAEIMSLYNSFLQKVYDKKYNEGLAIGEVLKNYLKQDTSYDGKIIYVDFLTAYSYCHWGIATEDNFVGNDTSWTDLENVGNVLINDSKISSKEFIDNGLDQFKFHYYRAILNQIETDLNWLDFEERKYSYNDAVVYLNQIRKYCSNEFGDAHEYTLLANYLYASYRIETDPIESVSILYSVVKKLPLKTASNKIPFLWSYNIDSDIAKKYIYSYDNFLDSLQAIPEVDSLKIKSILSGIDFNYLTTAYLQSSKFLDSSLFSSVVNTQLNVLKYISSFIDGKDRLIKNSPLIDELLKYSLESAVLNDTIIQINSNLTAGFLYFKRFEYTIDTSDLNKSFDSFNNSFLLSRKISDYTNLFKSLVEIIENYGIISFDTTSIIKLYYSEHEFEVLKYYQEFELMWPWIISAVKKDVNQDLDKHINIFIDLTAYIFNLQDINLTYESRFSHFDKCLDLVSASPSRSYGYASSKWLEILQDKFDTKHYGSENPIVDPQIYYMAINYLRQYSTFNFENKEKNFALRKKYDLLHSIFSSLIISSASIEDEVLTGLYKFVLRQDMSDSYLLANDTNNLSLFYAFELNRLYNENIYRSLAIDSIAITSNIDFVEYFKYLNKKLFNCRSINGNIEIFDIYDKNGLQVLLELFKHGAINQYESNVTSWWIKYLKSDCFLKDSVMLDLLDNYIWYLTYEKSNNRFEDYKTGRFLAKAFVDQFVANKDSLYFKVDLLTQMDLNFRFVRLYGICIEKGFDSKKTEQTEFVKECKMALDSLLRIRDNYNYEYNLYSVEIQNLLLDYYLQNELYDSAFSIINTVRNSFKYKLDTSSAKDWILYAMYCSQLSENIDSLKYYSQFYNDTFQSLDSLNYRVIKLNSDSCFKGNLVLDYYLPSGSYPAFEFDINANGVLDSAIDLRYYVNEKLELKRQFIQSQSFFVGEFNYLLGFKQYEKIRTEYVYAEDDPKLFYDSSKYTETIASFSYTQLKDLIKWTITIPINDLGLINKASVNVIAIAAYQEESNSTTYRQFRKETFPRSAIYSGFKDSIVIDFN